MAYCWKMDISIEQYVQLSFNTICSASDVQFLYVYNTYSSSKQYSYYICHEYFCTNYVNNFGSFVIGFGIFFYIIYDPRTWTQIEFSYINSIESVVFAAFSEFSKMIAELFVLGNWCR